jgi:protein tyrosine phosphatase (PTP) superfamily phosphohydrolase (DUF442 family)
MEGITNYLEISPMLGTAGQPTEEQFALLADAGYQVVINLAMGAPVDDLESDVDERELVTAQSMAYAHIPVVWERPTAADLSAFFQAMERFAGRRVFVHCAANLRVSCFVFLYRVLCLDVPVEEAREALQAVWEPNEVWQGFVDRMLVEMME